MSASAAFEGRVWPDYSGPFDPDAQLGDFGHRTPLRINQEAAVQAHLLVRAQLLGDESRLAAGVMDRVKRARTRI